MANYFSSTGESGLPQLEGTVIQGKSGKVLLQSANGKMRLRNQYSEERKTGIIKHYLTDAQLSTLQTFYTANENIAFNFTYAADSTVYVCMFSDAIKAVPKTGGYYDVTVSVFIP